MWPAIKIKVLSGSRWKERLLNHECLWMTDGMTLAKIPWRPFQNSKLPKQCIGLDRQTLSVYPKELFERAERRYSEGNRESRCLDIGSLLKATLNSTEKFCIEDYSKEKWGKCRVTAFCWSEHLEKVQIIYCKNYFFYTYGIWLMFLTLSPRLLLN